MFIMYVFDFLFDKYCSLNENLTTKDLGLDSYLN